MKIYYLFTILAFMAIILLACNEQRKQKIGDNSMILEYKDIQGFSLKIIQISNPTRLEISGLAMHSSLVVTELKTAVSSTKLNVKILLGITKKGFSGSFVFRIDVPDSVKDVVLGNNEYPIWQREIK